jgi:hypothetical protein
MARVPEPRSSERKLVTWRVRVMLSNGQVLDGKTTDASPNGLGIAMPVFIRDADQIQLAVQVPLHNTPGKFQVITGKARIAFQVLRGNEYQMGVEWVQVEPAKKQIIIYYLEKLSQPQRG